MHPVGQQHRFLDVVGDEEHPGPVAGAEVRHQLLHAQAGQSVEGGEGFVEQEQLRLAHQGPGQGHPLGLATRERARPGVGLWGQARLLGGRSRRAPRVAWARGRPRTTLRQTRWEATRRGSWKTTVRTSGTRTSPALAVLEPGQNAQERGLAAARGAEQRDELALGHGDVEVGQHGAVAEGLGHTVDDGGQVGADGGEGFIGPPGAASTAC